MDKAIEAALRERFDAKWTPEPNSGCWLWTGWMSTNGYGRFWNGTRGVQAHRFSYEKATGRTIPVGLEIDHRCRMRSCVNPDHLEAVTHTQNLRRSPDTLASVSARKTHCPQGHAYSPENIYLIGNNRKCKQCHNKRRNEIRRRQRALSSTGEDEHDAG